MYVTGVITQGRGEGDNRDEWVESFTVEYGNNIDGHMRTVTDLNGRIKVSKKSNKAFSELWRLRLKKTSIFIGLGRRI